MQMGLCLMMLMIMQTKILSPVKYVEENLTPIESKNIKQLAKKLQKGNPKFLI